VAELLSLSERKWSPSNAASLSTCTATSRPAIAKELLSVNQAGQVVLKLKTPYRDGTSHIVMSPLECMQRLAALVARPRLHLFGFHGGLAPHARLRAAMVPICAQTTATRAADCEPAHGTRARVSWARLLKGVFDIDVERCVCGAKLRIIAAIEAPAAIERMLTHPGCVGSTAAADTGAARRSLSGGLIRKPGLVLAGADGWAQLARVQARGFGEIGSCEGQDSAGNSGT
jgi:hypothetical protein